MVMLIQLQSSRFFHKIHLNTLSSGDMILVGNENLLKRKFHHNKNDMKLLIKYYL